MGNGIFTPLNARSSLPAQTEQGGLDMELNEKKTDLHTWQETICNRIFDDMEELLEYVTEFYLN